MRKEQLRTGGRGRIDPTSLHRGIVRDFDTTTGRYSVDVRGEVLFGCVDMVGPAGSFLGVQIHNRIPVGTAVLINPGSPDWIINTGTIEVPVPAQCHSRTMTGTSIKDILQETAGIKAGMPDKHIPNDLGEGEFEWKRARGPLFRFLMSLVQLGANDRSKIEMNLHRELVRIIAHNYEFFGATGDEKDYDDGLLNREYHGTPYEHERWGVREGEPLLEDQEEPPDPDEWVKKTGRWRWSHYLGGIGDLLNHWFTDPQEAAGEMLDAPDQYRSGKCRQHIGHDGSLLWQSVGDIALERVVRIPVPLRLKHEEDPKGVVRQKMKELDQAFLKQWKWDVTNPQHTAFMLRDHARYLNQFQSLARFLQLEAEGEFKVPSEQATPQPMEVDPDREPAVWLETYATIRIMRDGSIVNSDGYGNSWSSGPYGFKFAAVTDFQIYAARDIVLKAGRSMFLSARRHVELVAHVGSLIFKGRTAVRTLCEKGVVWIKSNFDPEDTYTPEEGDPQAETHGDVGVIFQGTNSKMLIDSKTLRVETRSGEDEEGLEIKTRSIKLQSHTAQIRFFDKLDLLGSKIRLQVSQLIGNTIGLLWLRNQMKFRGGQAELGNLHVRSLRSNSALAATSKNVGEIDPKEDLLDDEDQELPQTPAPLSNVRPERSWSMFEDQEYDPFEDLYEPISQQRIRLGEKLGPDPETPHPDTADFQDWQGMTQNLLPGDQTDTRPPWPGRARKWLTLTSPDHPELGVPSSGSGADFTPPNNPALQSQTIQFKYLNT